MSINISQQLKSKILFAVKIDKEYELRQRDFTVPSES